MNTSKKNSGILPPFQEEARQLHQKIHRAIIQQNTDDIASPAEGLREYWALALTRQYREGFRVVNGLFLRMAETAQLFAEDGTSEETLRRWACQWEYLGESGVLVETMHEEWRVDEDLDAVLKRFRYAEKTLMFLNEHSMASTAQLQEFFRKEVLKEEQAESASEEKKSIAARLNNHLRRLMNYQLIDRAAHGMYHLTERGFAVVERMPEAAKDSIEKNLFHYYFNGIKEAESKKISRSSSHRHAHPPDQTNAKRHTRPRRNKDTPKDNRETMSTKEKARGIKNNSKSPIDGWQELSLSQKAA